MSGFAALRAAAPSWALLLADGAACTDWIAGPPLPSGGAVPATIVRVMDEGGFLFASERDPGTRLPIRCPELHIVRGSGFCLGYGDYRSDSPVDAGAFWQDLGEFLVNQHHAARRGRWPAGRWISHGEAAARLQFEAEELASGLGVDAAYSDCIENDEGWIAEAARGAGRRIRGLTVCPVGCLDGAGRAADLVDCGHLAPVRRLVTVERGRRSAQSDHYRMLRREGVVCCGRMPRCPLNDRIAA